MALMDHARVNDLGQPIGEDVDFVVPSCPSRKTLQGTACRVEPLEPLHAAALYAEPQGAGQWTYLPYGPFASAAEHAQWVEDAAKSEDPLFFAVIDEARGSAVGVVSYLRINPAAGSVEVGNINYYPALQRTVAGTEAMYLMMREAFQLGYRRYEWKCDALNAKSQGPARRYGFTFEGVFRQATVYKGRNRDTAWFSVLDSEWKSVEAAFKRWLGAENFDAEGNQLVSLRTLMQAKLC